MGVVLFVIWLMAIVTAFTGRFRLLDLLLLAFVSVVIAVTL